MNNVLKNMFDGFGECNDVISAKNICKQIIQEISLCGLARSDFFKRCAFNGGTALRIFYGLQRFSEGLDFSIDCNFCDDIEIEKYEKYVNNELASLHVPCKMQKDNSEGAVKRAYVKGNCRAILEAFEVDRSIVEKVVPNELVKIKIEIDTTILKDAEYEIRYLLRPYPSAVRVYDIKTMFSGKIDAILTRGWKNRIKGRDFYDYLFYMNNRCCVNMKHLRNRLINSGLIDNDYILNNESLKELLIDRFAAINIEDAKKDVTSFIKNGRELDFWSNDLFVQITRLYTFKQ